MNVFNRLQYSINSISKKTFYTAIVLFLLIDAAILFVALKGSLIGSRHLLSNISGLEYGQYFERNKVFELCSLSPPDPAGLKNAKLLVVFPKPSRLALEELDYINLLYHRYGNWGLAVIGIMKTSQPEIVELYRKRLGLSFPLVNDSTGRTTEYFGVENGSGGLLMIDHNDTVRFFLHPYLDEHITRQLVESQVLGYNRITFAKESLDSQLKPGENIGTLTLLDLSNSDMKSLREVLSKKLALLTFVDEICTFCRAESVRIATLNNLAKSIGERLDLVIITRASIPFLATRKFLDSTKFAGKCYATSDRVFALSDYCTEVNLKKPVMSVLVDPAGSVLYVEMIDDGEKSMTMKVTKLVWNKSFTAYAEEK